MINRMAPDRYTMHRFLYRNLLLSALLVVVSGCGGDASPSPGGTATVPVNATVTLSWAANPETELNKAGGGYRIYYSQNSSFQPGDPGVQTVNVPYIAGPRAPTAIDIAVTASGTWYFRVQGYSALNPQGGPLSPPFAVTVPAP